MTCSTRILATAFFLAQFIQGQQFSRSFAPPPAPNILVQSAESYFSLPQEEGVGGEDSATDPAPNKWVLLKNRPAAILHDQKAIWSSPAQIKARDLQWLLPLGAATGLLIGSDRHTMTESIRSNTLARQRASDFSNAGLASLGALPVAFYGVGLLKRNRHAQETGLLGGEAMVDALAVGEAFKLITSRERPWESRGQGHFWSGSPFHSSFPSNHSILAWSAASVIAQEYPGPVTQWGAYGLATAVSVSRILAERHFPSDVLIGAAAGYLIGHYVYREHHRSLRGDEAEAMPVAKGSPTKPKPWKEDEPHGSVYVPLDSWVYPALRRLAALGYVPDQAGLIAPWTRLDCLRQVEEAEDLASRRMVKRAAGASNEEALRLIAGLKAEFSHERTGGDTLQLESVYTRFTGISGTPLRDSYHFGQTLVNDFGRPYEEGLNNITGFSTYATSGRFFAYVRGEYQHAPGRPSDSLSIRDFIGQADSNPTPGPNAIATANQFEPLEMYAGVALWKLNVSFGKESLWWGPGEQSALHFSNNAQPFYQLRISQSDPIVLPGFLSALGHIRSEFLFGKLSGHNYPPRPFINAQKIMFQLTENLELGVTRSSIFGGVGHPLTFGSLSRSLFSVGDTVSNGLGSVNDPGDRRSGFDFKWRLPGVRRYVTIYSDSLSDDDPNPLDNPRRAAWAPGLYLSQLPGLRRMDFRFETYSTWLYRKDYGGQFLYYNNQYHDAYTNRGYLLGSWVGRDSRAYTAQATYWFSSQTKLQGLYKQIKVGSNFLTGGGTQTDAQLNGLWQFKPEWQLSAFAQYERYYIPLLGGPRHDIASGVQVTFAPEKLSLHR